MSDKAVVAEPTLSPPPSTGRPRVTAQDVERAADALLRAGERPTIERIRLKMGRGSPNTIQPLLDHWWKRIAARLDSGPAALHRIPESVLHIVEALWLQVLAEARVRAETEVATESSRHAEARETLEVRSYVLTLREGELDRKLRDQQAVTADLQEQVRTLTTMVRLEQAGREFERQRLNQLLAGQKTTRAATRAIGKSGARRPSVNPAPRPRASTGKAVTRAAIVASPVTRAARKRRLGTGSHRRQRKR